MRIVGDTGDYSSTGAQLTHAQFELLQHPGRGEAEAISTVQPNVFELKNVTYTTCPKGVADWELRSRSITLDTNTLRGVGHHTVVVFKDVPILYLPWISFPLSSARQSGFLYPTLGSSSQSGAIFSIPWYWNIAPNQDLTATPTVYTRRGVDLGAEYRLLEHDGQGDGAHQLPAERQPARQRQSQLAATGCGRQSRRPVARRESTSRTSATRITSRISAMDRWPAARSSCRAT